MTTVAYTINTPPNACSQLQEIMDSGSGIFQTQKFAGDVLDLIAKSARIIGHPFEQWEAASGIFHNGALGITIPYAISSTIDCGKTAVSLVNRGVCLTWREGAEFVQQIAVSVQMLSYSAYLFTQKSICGVAGAKFCGVVGDVFGAMDDGLDAILAGEHLYDLNSKQVEHLSDAAKVYLGESKKLHFLKLVKAVIATAVGVFELLALALGGALLSPVALLAMATMSSGLAIINRVYKDNMTYKIIPPSA
jgi:hypothetical protein